MVRCLLGRATRKWQYARDQPIGAKLDAVFEQSLKDKGDKGIVTHGTRVGSD